MSTSQAHGTTFSGIITAGGRPARRHVRARGAGRVAQGAAEAGAGDGAEGGDVGVVAGRQAALACGEAELDGGDGRAHAGGVVEGDAALGGEHGEVAVD